MNTHCTQWDLFLCLGDTMFEFFDGGQVFPKNFSIKTDSIEVIISHLLKKGISNNSELSPFYTGTKYLSSTDARQE